MRQETLTTIKGGLNRLRTKGAALNDSLYDLLNGYVTTEKTIQVRPGTVLDHTLPAGTFGLTGFEGKLHVFASADVIGIDTDNFVLHLLRSPNGEVLSKVHFAEPFLGILYVAAEFADGAVYHFWLREGITWTADTDYDANAIAEPTSVNTFTYRATRAGAAYPLWSEGAPRSINDNVEPLVASGFYFTVNQIFGTNAISGIVEPDWGNVTSGQLVVENVDGTIVPSAATPPSIPLDNTLPGSIKDRYIDRELN